MQIITLSVPTAKLRFAMCADYNADDVNLVTPLYWKSQKMRAYTYAHTYLQS